MRADRRLIEETLPILAISREAAREKSIRQGHIAGLHTWWARRPLVACRAAIIGCLLSDPKTQKERESLEYLVSEGCQWETGTDSVVLKEVRRRILSANGGRAPRVLDCFAGGGSIPLEAIRLGCEATALDLNPVAHLIEMCTLAFPQTYGKPAQVSGNQTGLGSGRTTENRLAYDVQRWGDWVGTEAERELANIYPNDSDGSIPNTYLWARSVTCPNLRCKAEIPLVRQTWLSKSGRKPVAFRMVTDGDRKQIRFEVVEGRIHGFDPGRGTMKGGTVKCPMPGCDGALSGAQLRELGQQGKMNFTGIPMVVVLSKEKSGKKYRPFSVQDRAAFEKAAQRLRELNQASLSGVPPIPDEPLPPQGTLGFRVRNYGLKRWGDLFNERQALVIATLVDKVKVAHARILQETNDPDYSRAVATYLALAVDRVASFCSTQCVFNPVEGQRVANVFGRNALPMVWDYAETNPFNPSGASWRRAVEAGRDTILAASLSGTIHLECGTATALPFTDGSFDLVMTDPPYYDSVPYSHLSDFFYVWLKRSVGTLYPNLFSTPLTPKRAEIVQSDAPVGGLVKDKQFFETEMSNAFGEIHRVLKPGGVACIVFAHKTTTAWETLVSALVNASFVVTASWPLHTERPGRLRAQSSAALSSSTWLVCHMREATVMPGSWKIIQSELEKRVRERMEYLLKHGIRGADAMLSSIGPALEIYSRHPYVEKVTGEKVSVQEFMDKVREVSSQQALSNVMDSKVMGKVDPTTAFYVLWKWSYEASDEAIPVSDRQDDAREENETDGAGSNGEVAIPADDAFKLAQAVGAEFDSLTGTAGVLEKQGETVRLLRPSDRRDVRGLGEPTDDGRASPIIDVLHHSLHLWQDGKRRLLDEYLTERAVKSSEGFWGVVSGLSRILPIESKEKQLIDGFWSQYGRSAGWPMPATRAERSQRKMDNFAEESA